MTKTREQVQLEDSLSRVLWDDFETDSTFPKFRPLLAHYTSIETLEKILKHDELWLSNPLHMNDFEELRYGMLEGAREFRESELLRAACGTDENHSKLLHLFNYLFDDFDINHAFDTYIMCLTEHENDDNDGVLSMWRGYGATGSGAAIVFDSALVSVNDSSPLIIARVRYGTDSERKAWIKSKVDSISTTISKIQLSEELLFTIAYQWMERLKLFSLFTKHRGFSEEREWRVAYMSQRDLGGYLKPMLSYSIGHRGIEPKLKLKIGPVDGLFPDDLSLNSLINRIIMGPTTSGILAINSVKRMLDELKKSDLKDKVHPSSIPFRK